MIEYIVIFLLWTFCLYWIHRLVHAIPVIRNVHFDHHKFINLNGKANWDWNNLLLFNDTWISTIDLWITEIIPTILFSWITGHWWVTIFYYVWAAFIQEKIEHNPSVNLYPFLTSGNWHLSHHKNPKNNFGLFIPIWDKPRIDSRKQ